MSSPEMTAEERLALISETYTYVYCMTESFDEQNIGADLSYLFGAIAQGRSSGVLLDSKQTALLKILQGWHDAKNRERVLSFVDIE